MLNKQPGVLIVDDEQVVCDLLCDELSEQGYLCTTALDGYDALAKLATQDFDVVLLDIKLPGISGIEVLRKVQSGHPSTVAIMITAVNDVDTAVEAMKLGALDYIVKPFDLDSVDTSIRTVLEAKQTMEESSSEMNAIARGVEAEYELLTGYSHIVTHRTIDIALELGIADEEIQEWADARARLDFERNRVIASLLNKLQRSLLAQYVMAMTEPYQHPSNLNESEN